jgi:hypothetical protein
VFVPLTTKEPARAALEFINEKLGKRTVVDEPERRNIRRSIMLTGQQSKSVSAAPPIPGINVIDCVAYALCQRKSA